ILNDLIIHDLETNKVYKEYNVHGYIPPRRYCAASATYDNKIIVFGGSQETAYLNDIHVFDTETLRWSHCWTSFRLSTRKSHSMIADGNSLYILGGKEYGQKTSINSFIIVDNISTLIWRSKDYTESLNKKKMESEK